jgi:hypothetical protein
MVAVPKPEPKDWQVTNAQQLQLGDGEVLRMLRDAFNRVNRQLRALPADKDVTRAQLERTRQVLLSEQAAIFDKLGDLTNARRLRAASRAAALSAASEAALVRAAGAKSTADDLYRSLLQTSQAGVQAAMARLGYSALPLSQRIYNVRVWMDGRLNRLINATLATGLNAAKFAKEARDWFNPNTPGGVRYASLRLARTEINNAFHSITVQKAIDSPWTPYMQWNLSKSHPKPDECNILADHDEGHGVGIFPSEEVPVRPHPQCMCYVTPEPIDEDAFVDNFLNGDYDDYLDKELAKEDKRIAGAAPTDQTTLATVTPIRPEPIPEVKALPFGEAAQALVPKGLFKRGSMTPKQREALKIYETGWFVVINNRLREQKRDVLEDAIDRKDEQTIVLIDEAMAQSALPEPIQVWRGLFGAESIFGDSFEHDLSGFSWEDRGYGSTTTNEDVVDFFTGRYGGKAPAPNSVKLKVTVSAGVQALQTSSHTKGSKENGAQAEITLQHDLVWKVTKDNGLDSNGVRQLEVSVDRAGVSSNRSATGAGANDGGQIASPQPSAQTTNSAPELTFASAATDQEALDAPALGLGRSDRPAKFTTAMSSAISNYTGAYYKDINARLRGKPLPADEEEPRVSEWISGLDAAMKASPLSRDVVVHRGIYNASTIFGDRLKGSLLGMEWREDSYVSTTAVEARTSLFLSGSRARERLLIRILVPKGSKAVQASLKGAEAEILLDRGQRFRVVADYGVNPQGIRQIDVELIND